MDSTVEPQPRSASRLDFLSFDKAVERYSAFFKENVAERHAFLRSALHIKRYDMAAIAACAERKLGGGQAADAMVGQVVDGALADADAAIADGDHKREAECLAAASHAAISREHVEAVAARVGARLAEELERDPFELDVISGLLRVGSTDMEKLLEIFHKSHAMKAYEVAGLAAGVIADAMPRRVDKDLVNTLRSSAREMLLEKNFVSAAAYLCPLNRLVPNNDSIVALVSRAAKSLATSLDAALTAGEPASKTEPLAAGLSRLEPSSPSLNRYRLHLALAAGNQTDIRECLERLHASGFEKWSLIINLARAAYKDGDVRSALTLYGWLAEHGQAVQEVEKVRTAEFRKRLQAMKEATNAESDIAERAAAAVLELDPKHDRALWIHGRALLKMRRYGEAVASLRSLVAVSSNYPKATALIEKYAAKGLS